MREDVYLLPDDDAYTDDALWLTIDALGDPSNSAHGSERAELEARLAGPSFVIEGANMSVNVDQGELLAWVRVYLEASGLHVKWLLKATFEVFETRCEHARMLATVKSVVEGGDPVLE